ncbi:carboxypeptidase-like regulatory domain-containing protein [Winogradskyella litorisediminis]|uniref:Carboxypeptidase-like regulatory domain-containing protein n=1 Tax=Winogradskyella litorisediminis TaxID=1156618 RepID=A0ABW3N8C1_9FLAO
MKRLLQIITILFVAFGLNAQNSPKVNIGKNKELKLSKLSVNAEISGQYAKVTYDMTFYNGLNRILEGELAFPLGQGQTVSHLSMDLNGYLRDAVIVEKELGRVAYENTIEQRIDPALLEQTKGNNYKVRVYPIPAKGYKRIVLSYEQSLQSENDNYLLELPFDFKTRLDNFELNVVQNSKTQMPIVDGYFENKLNFKKFKGKLIAKLKQDNASVKKSLKLSIPIETESSVLVKDDYFYFNQIITAQPRVKKKPESLTLLWDSSYSMLYKNKAKEIELLDAYLKKLNNVSIDLVVFSNTIIKKQSFVVKNGNWEALKNSLEAVVYDGGTWYSNLPIVNNEEVILVSDGMFNLGGLSTKNIKRLYAINSVKSANHQILEKEANTLGGSYVNLVRESTSNAINKLLNEPLQFLGVKDNNRVFEVYPKSGTIINGNFSIAGKHFNSGAVQLLFGYNGEVTDSAFIDIENGIQSDIAQRLWSKQKLKTLLNNQEENKDLIIMHCQEHHLISPYTSMIVLDRVEDYARYKIEPPKELLAQYNRLIRNNKQQEVAENKRINERKEDLKDEYEDIIAWYNKDFSVKPKVKSHSQKTTSMTTNSTEINSTSISANRNNFDASKPNISGTVTSQTDRLPLPGVNVYVKGTTRGTQTDFDGKYQINAETGETIVFSFVSMETLEMKLTNLNSINVSMKEDSASLDEVVITGYSTTTKAKSSVSSVRVSSETIQNRPNASFVQTLSGQVPGLNITKSSGQPGGSSLVQLRGVGSISGNIQPLFVVDGVPVSEDNFRNLSPDEIKSISVLKDAGATAIYGSRGANGVIVISTKEGAENNAEAISQLEKKIGEQTKLKSWQKNAPYLALLNEQTNIDTAYDLYLELRAEYHNMPSFFVDVAEYFETKNNKEYALRIVSNLIEIELDNHELIRALAYKLEAYKEFDLAVHVYKEVLNLRPEEPQSYRDLALAYEAAGDYKSAYDMFNAIVEGELLEKDQRNRFSGIEKIAYTEMSRLVHTKSELSKYRDEIAKLDSDIRVVIDWNHNNTDLDLHIKNPNGDELYYGKKTSKFGGIISDDFTDGYGPETFKLKKATKGKYEISVVYFSDDVQKIIGPTSLKVTVFRNYGKPNETKEVKVYRLTDKEGNIEAKTLII